MSGRAGAIAFVVGLITVVACGNFGASDDETPSVDLGDAGTHDAAQTSSGATDPDATVSDGATTDASGSVGAPMLQIQAGTNTFFIDATEATVDEWNRTIAANTWADVRANVHFPDACKGPSKKDWTVRATAIAETKCVVAPSAHGLTTALDEPVNCVDWCDAWAFCLANQKRLCGRLGGGAIGPQPTANQLESEVISTQNSEWTFACGGSTGLAFPYGNERDNGKCNQLTAQPRPASAFPSCVGSVGGLFEMAGNVNEWENACTADTELAVCTARGGAYLSDQATGCKATHNGLLPVRLNGYDDVGIRCCADAAP